ncbi:MAG TPA: GNAT family N-acetyltransferase [Vicinamibacterales bacterium]|nr:GNAT family N-acetyltransferase [Vicinamibacterales bacterium]
MPQDEAPRHNTEKKRFELQIGDALAFVAYRDLPNGTRVFVHTEVPPAVEGHGVGSRLVKAALDEAKAAGRHVAAPCPFVAGYIARHQEYESLTSA